MQAFVCNYIPCLYRSHLVAAESHTHLWKRCRLLLQSCILLLHMRLHDWLLWQGRLKRRHWLLSVLLHGRGLRLLLLLRRGNGCVAICRCCSWLLGFA